MCFFRALVAAALLILVCHGSVRAAPKNTAQSVYRLDPAFDTSLLLGGAALWTTAFFVVSPLQKNRACDPCDPETLNGLDRPFVRFHNPDWRPVGHIAYALPALAFVFLDMHDVGWKNWRVWSTDFLVIMEALILQGVVTEVFRRAIERPRPFLYEAGVYPEDRSAGEATFSFYSGHVSGVFALFTGIAYTWTLRHNTSRFLIPVWVGLLLTAMISPISRVASGDHFPTDVLVGAAVGTAFGVGWPALRHMQYKSWNALQQLSVTPYSTEGGMGVSLGGRF